jgi:hypothetical protein
MCLHTYDNEKTIHLKKEMVAYKVVLKHTDLDSDNAVYYTSRIFGNCATIGKGWRMDNACEHNNIRIRTKDDSAYYLPGVHAYTRKKDAISVLKSNAGGTINRCTIIKVRLTHPIAYGTESPFIRFKMGEYVSANVTRIRMRAMPVVVYKEMIILEEVRLN